MTIRLAAVLLLALLVVIAAVVIFVGPVRAHHAPSGWPYPQECCGGSDCAQLEPGDVKWTPEGWLIVLTGEVIAFDQARDSGDHDWHRCRVTVSDPNSMTRKGWSGKPCLYVPEAEF